jgi:hypothetical protein
MVSPKGGEMESERLRKERAIGELLFMWDEEGIDICDGFESICIEWKDSLKVAKFLYRLAKEAEEMDL